MPRPRIQLKAVTPALAGQTWTSDSRLRVGRVSNLEVVLDDPSISRYHAEISATKTGFLVRDLGSTNGTFLNKVRVGQAGQELRSGDIVRFGNIALTVLVSRENPRPRTNAAAPAEGKTQEKAAEELEKPARLAGMEEVVLQTVTALAQAVELRDKYTGGHTQRVTNYALLLAERLGMSATDRMLLRVGVPLHDIGKIGVDDAILRKAAPLDSQEFQRMQSHPVRGAEILGSIPGLAPVLPIVRSHHERWDGQGYPDGLAGEQIPMLARVVAVADAFDAMTSDRPYRPGMPLRKALAEIAAGAGSQFDPHCVECFLTLEAYLEEMLQQRQSLGETYEQAALAPGLQDLLARQ